MARSGIAFVAAAIAWVPACYGHHHRSDAARPDVGARDAAPAPSTDAARDAPVLDDCTSRGEMLEVIRDHGYRIGATEVPQQEYARFLRCAVAPRLLAGCTEDSLEPLWYDYAPEATPDLPVNGVSFCAAAAYCEWAGGRLCRLEEEWLPACHSTRDRVAPGDFVRPSDGDLCVLAGFDGDWDDGPNLTQPVGSVPTCRGLAAPFDRVFDVIGNVEEHVTIEGSRGWYVGHGAGSGPDNPCETHSAALDVREPISGAGIRCCGD